jgi:prophage regulatory protein
LKNSRLIAPSIQPAGKNGTNKVRVDWRGPTQTSAAHRPPNAAIAKPTVPPGHIATSFSTGGRSVPGNLLRLSDVRKATGLCRSSIYQLQAEGSFPHSIKLNERAVAWLEDEVRDWIASKINASRQGSESKQ